MSKDIGANANNHHLNNTTPFECFTGRVPRHQSPLLILSFVFLDAVFNILFAKAQQDGTNFLTYANTILGFTMKHTSNWIVNDSNIVNGHKVVSFTPADKVGIVFVQVQNATQLK
jgi:hypothetical protein